MGTTLLSFELVGWAPRSPRDWWVHVPEGRPAAEIVSRQLMGGSPLFRGVRKTSEVASSGLVGVAISGPVVLVAWSGVPVSAFAWDQLPRDPRCQRFSVSVSPASSSMEARWEDASGEIRRHVAISNSELITNVGEAHLVDEDADTDRTLRVREGVRLSASVVKGLLAAASESDVKTYDGRRYVRTSDRKVLRQARIVHTDRDRQTWVAVDQAGPVNTLFDPLADLTGPLDPGDLADQVAAAWFRARMSSSEAGPPLSCYAWPDAPEVQGLATAIHTIQQDQAGFFALLGTATWDDVGDIVAKHYAMSHRDVADLLQEPLANLLPHRPTDAPGSS